MASSPFNGVALHILPASQDFPLFSFEDVRRRDLAQCFAVTPTIADEGDNGHLQIAGQLIGQLVRPHIE